MVKDVSIILQARMGSSRLPGKVMRPLADKTLLGHILTRLKQSRKTAAVIVATGDTPDNDCVEAECARYDVKCFRGSETDVLDRYYHAALAWDCAHINRICADNPFVDSRLVDAVTSFYQAHDYEYIAMRGFPVGVGFEIFTFERLAEAFVHGHEAQQREHVTPYIRESNANKFYYQSEKNHSGYRLTVDTEEDWSAASRLYEELYKGRHDFYLEDVLPQLHKREE